jgi:hypothetical protein
MSNLLDDLGIPELNWDFHIELDKAMYKKLNGLLTFVIRVDNRRITDYSEMESKNYGKPRK